jgi:hypothetical protein
MKQQIVQSQTEGPLGPGGIRAAKAVARDRGVGPVTIWRWAQRGWINVVNISGRPYVDLASLKEFDDRARRGEFAKAPAGAAGRSHKVRLGKGGQ